MGDELCRYKNLINLNNKGRIASVKMETFPLYTEVFNLHEKISFSDIDINSSNKIVKTQKYINYKILKSFFKIKKKFQSKFDKNIYYQINQKKRCQLMNLETKLFNHHKARKNYEYLSARS